jgi:hypothetical protein
MYPVMPAAVLHRSGKAGTGRCGSSLGWFVPCSGAAEYG